MRCVFSVYAIIRAHYRIGRSLLYDGLEAGEINLSESALPYVCGNDHAIGFLIV